MKSRIAAIVAVVVLLGASQALAQTDPDNSPVACGEEFVEYSRDPVATGSRTMTEVPIVMSDGVTLYADVTVPTGVDGPFPTLLQVTGYNKSALRIAGSSGSDAIGLAEYGYAIVAVDDRGTGTSEGEWDAWGERTRADYPEVIDWIVEQDWSNGRVGLNGTSYSGITALFGAGSGHDAVEGVFASVPMGDAYRDIVYQGGQANFAFIPMWMGLVTVLSVLPAGSDPSVLLEHLLNIVDFQIPTVADAVLGTAPSTEAGDFWWQRSPLSVADRIEAPTFVVGGLDDIFQRGEPMLYEAIANGTEARLLIGPWTHSNINSGLDDAGIPTTGRLMLQWMDGHVMGLDAATECIPEVTQYYRGVDEYRTAPSWPVPDLSAERMYLRGDDSLTFEAPGDEGSSTYMQLPINGLCTRSMNQWLAGALAMAQTPCGNENTLDETLALTWTTDPFTEPMLINGPIEADLWLRTALGPEALTSVALSLIGPDGVSRGVSNGQLTLSDRAVDAERSRMLEGQSIQPWHPFTHEAAQSVPVGEPVLARVEVFPTSMEIPPGYRLRVTVAAYDVPHALPPLPTALLTMGGPVDVLHTAEHPSSIVFPVVAAAAAADPVVAPALPEPSAPAAVGSGGGTLPATGADPPLAALVSLLAAAALTRRLRRSG